MPHWDPILLCCEMAWTRRSQPILFSGGADRRPGSLSEGWNSSPDAWRSRMLPDIPQYNTHHQGDPFSPLGPVALLARQGSTPTSVGYPIRTRRHCFLWLQTTCGRSNADHIRWLFWACFSELRRRPGAGSWAEHAAFSLLALSQRKMRRRWPQCLGGR